jgi:hypothetical protein
MITLRVGPKNPASVNSAPFRVLNRLVWQAETEDPNTPEYSCLP